MIPHTQMQEYVNQINQKFSVHTCWSDYNIRLFKRKKHPIQAHFPFIPYESLPPYSTSRTCHFIEHKPAINLAPLAREISIATYLQKVLLQNKNKSFQKFCILLRLLYLAVMKG